MIYLKYEKGFDLLDIVEAISKEGRDVARHAIISLDLTMADGQFTKGLILKLVESLRKDDVKIKLEIVGEKF